MPPNLIADDQTAKKLVAANQGCKAHDLNQDQLNDLELLLYGNYQPLNGYLSEKDYLSVLENFCLEDGSPWSKLLSLQVNKNLFEEIEIGETVSLLDPEGVLIAFIFVSSIFSNEGRYYFGGEVIGIELPYRSGKEAMRLYQHPDSLEFETMFLCNNLLHTSEINHLKNHFKVILFLIKRIKILLITGNIV